MLIPCWLTRSLRARPQDANKRPRSFRPGVESLEVRDLMAATLAVSDVGVVEGDHGTVNAVIGDGQGLGTIFNDDYHDSNRGGNHCPHGEKC